MAVTQYIGARYVPLFADPLEWNDTRTYEPLTIVLHKGSSYTSRQFVPLGTDIENTDYWAFTGNYNAQVEQYRQETKEAVVHVDALITKTEADIAVINGTLSTHTTDIAANASDISGLSTRMTTAEVDIAANASDISGLSTRMTTAEADIAANASDISGLSTRMTTTEADITTINSNVSKLAEKTSTDISAKLDKSVFDANALVNPTSTYAGAIKAGTSSLLDISKVLDVNSADTTVPTSKTVYEALKAVKPISSYHSMTYIGDSWGNGFYSSTSHVNDGTAVALGNALGIDGNKVYNLSVNASGFTVNGDSRSFGSQWTNASAAAKATDLVVICGGQNDANASQDAVANACSTLITNIHTVNPSCDIVIFNTPLSRGRTLNSSGTLYPVVMGIDQAVRSKAIPGLLLIDGCRRWVANADSSLIDDAWHLTASGYAYFASQMASCIMSKQDWWPTFSGSFTKNTTTLPNASQNYARESNGIVTINLAVQATTSNPISISNSWSLPAFCITSESFFVTGVGQNNPGLFLSFDNSATNVKVTVQGVAVSANDWLFITFSWMAGM